MSDTMLLPPSARETPSGSATTNAIERGMLERSWLGKLLGIFLAVLAFGAGWVLADRNARQRGKEGLPSETGVVERDSTVVVVTVEPVTYRPVQRTVEGMGTLHGFEEVTISARVEGLVRKIRFDVADLVKPGDLLLEIDPTDAELSVRQAERTLQVELAKLGLSEPPTSSIDLGKVPTIALAHTRMENAQSRLERARRLSATRSITAEELDTATSDSRAAKAEYDNQLLVARAGLATIQMKQAALAVARQQLEDTQVRAPTPSVPVPDVSGGFAYAVAGRAVSEGSLVRPGSEICKLVINRTLKLRVPVPERYNAEVRLGQKAEVQTAALPRALTGTVRRINPTVDPTTRTFEVEIQIPNPGGEMRPGSFAKAAIRTRLDAEAVTVPLTALVNFAGINKVFVAENGRAKEVQVALGAQTTEWAEIAKPALPRGTRVITSGQTVLANGTPIAVRGAAPREGRTP